MNTLPKFLFFFIYGLLFICSNSYGQKRVVSRSVLVKEKKAFQMKVEETQKILSNTQTQKKASSRELKSVLVQIENQEGLIKLLETEISLLDTELKEISQQTIKLNEKLQNLRKEYAEMIYIAGKASGQMNQLTFLFSSRSFQEMYIRYKYLQQYTENRKQQLVGIQKVANQLNEKKNSTFQKKRDKKNILLSTQKEYETLRNLLVEKEKLVNSLSQQEEILRKEIEQTNQSIKKLDNLISSIVSKEIAKSESKPKKQMTRSLPKGNNTSSSSTSKVGFASLKNKLSWPVSPGFISDKFGIKNHPVLPGVKIDNNGVDIQTLPKASVNAVYKGKVLDISDIPGLGKVVAIQHDEYYTVYANLEDVSVRIGDVVAEKTVIGKAGLRENVSEINFQIWHQFDRQNPEIWLLNNK
mgnify:FL=1